MLCSFPLSIPPSVSIRSCRCFSPGFISLRLSSPRRHSFLFLRFMTNSASQVVILTSRQHRQTLVVERLGHRIDLARALYQIRARTSSFIKPLSRQQQELPTSHTALNLIRSPSSSAATHFSSIVTPPNTETIKEECRGARQSRVPHLTSNHTSSKHTPTAIQGTASNRICSMASSQLMGSTPKRPHFQLQASLNDRQTFSKYPDSYISNLAEMPKGSYNKLSA